MDKQRSEYLGVYNNTQDSSKADVPFRAAIRRGSGKNASWVNLGYVKSERVAARIYNMYAIRFFGKGAILNDVTLTHPELMEFEEFVQARDNRVATLAGAREKANTLLAANHVFRKHTELQKRTVAEQVALPV